MKISALDELFMEQLKDLYDAEHQLVEALPKMAEAATDRNLAAAFTQHLAETQNHVSRLEQVFDACGEDPVRRTCDGIKGLIKEGEKSIKETDDPAVRDAALVAAAQKVEHYGIASYGTLIGWSRTSGWSTELELLQETLEEERAADEKLTEIVEAELNAAAEAGDSGEGEEDTQKKPTASRSKTSGRTSSGGSRSKAPARSRRAKR